MKVVPDIAEVYQEQLPSEDQGVRESYARECATQDRITKMKLSGWKKGYNLTFRPGVADYDILFPELKFTEKENLPRIKMKELKPLTLAEDL